MRDISTCFSCKFFGTTCSGYAEICTFTPRVDISEEERHKKLQTLKKVGRRMSNNEQTESLISRYQNDNMSGAFIAGPTEIRQAIEKSEIYKRGFEDARKRYEKPQGEWIPCKDRLPEKQGQYLITSHCGVIGVLYYSPDLYSVDKHDFCRYKIHRKAGWYDYDSECGYFEYSTPKAWQELPEPYEEEEVYGDY